jgi:hypothetical protein
MALSHWYELRVAGSAGTSSEIAGGMKEGIALGENGRLCSVVSGHAKKFESRQQALDFLARTTIPGIYNFEAVRCPSPPAKRSSGPAPRPPR